MDEGLEAIAADEAATAGAAQETLDLQWAEAEVEVPDCENHGK